MDGAAFGPAGQDLDVGGVRCGGIARDVREPRKPVLVALRKSRCESSMQTRNHGLSGEARRTRTETDCFGRMNGCACGLSGMVGAYLPVANLPLTPARRAEVELAGNESRTSVACHGDSRLIHAVAVSDMSRTGLTQLRKRDYFLPWCQSRTR